MKALFFMDKFAPRQIGKTFVVIVFVILILFVALMLAFGVHPINKRKASDADQIVIENINNK
ncbi:hypothetical protein HN858_04530 [Candidatus Falkowbacteria bacterium]|jgi:hypothetical protein|nr:hypothetical protein [Candidatus Falkowbacteria bacterium]MBT5503851.1 hypothetical protein [Candidatus Falkowbacteria bacterium]MBT6574394.1 hypothetical protein [Candidatus Falkowbacteria bacterium]MBT7348911.1 hypothetical protein [Candidatus Falkowbacteria bacterium]MBT7501267.1 hypothetical protein [Candidatus Falkowbacteria bacterium]